MYRFPSVSGRTGKWLSIHLPDTSRYFMYPRRRCIDPPSERGRRCMCPERGRTLVPGRTIVRNSGWRARVRVTALPVGGAPGTGRTLLLNRNGAGGRLAETDLADSRSRARRALGGGFVRNGHNTPLVTGSEGRLALDHGRVGPGVPSFRNFPVALVHDFGRRSSIPTSICTISTHLATADAIVA